MSWLSGWAKRIKLTADCVKIDANQTHFPVTVILSSVHGAEVFTELGADANRKKVAFTKANGEQLYAEIEQFDLANQKAVYHVSASGWEVSSGTDTDFYMYYDVSQVENTTHIGDVTETPVQSVWDSNFKLVMHMAQDPNGDAANVIKDSTSNANHGTPAGGMTSADLVDGKVGKAIDFDGSNDHIIIGASISPGTGTFTVESVFKTSKDYSGNDGAIYSDYGAVQNNTVQLMIGTGNNLYAKYRDGEADSIDPIGVGAVNDGVCHYAAAVRTIQTAATLYFDNGVNNWSDSDANCGAIDTSDGITPKIGRLGPYTDYDFQGIIDEIRISNIARSAAWIKVTYHSLWDSLLTYGEEEEAPPAITEASVVFVGQIKDVSFKGVAASVNCVGFEHFLKQTIPKWRYQLTCNHMIFDSKCTKAEADYKTTTMVTLDSTGTELTSADFDALEDGYFTGGKVVFGDEARTIVNHVGSIVTLMYKMKELKDNDSVDAYPGCDGRIETCKDKFDNLINFLGFPFIPEENPALRVSW